MAKDCRVKARNKVLIFRDPYSPTRQVLANNVSFFPEDQTVDWRKITEECLDDVKISEERPSAHEATRTIRHVLPEFKSIYGLDFLWKGRNCPRVDKVAFALSPEAARDCGYDYVTYNSPEYQSCMKDFAREMIDSGLAEPDDAYALLTDYSLWLPYSNQIRQDGAWETRDPYRHHPEVIAGFRHEFSVLLGKIFSQSDETLVKMKPKVHLNKALGAYSVDLQRRRITRADLSYATSALSKGEGLGVYARVNTYLNKLEFAKAGIPLRSFKFGVEHVDDLFTEPVLREGLEKMAINIYKEAYRDNETESILYTNASIDEMLRKKDDKHRTVSIMLDDFHFKNGSVNMEKWYSRCPERNFYRGKHRSMFPSANNTFSPIFIYACRLPMKTMEDRENGFLSNKATVLDAANEAFRKLFSRYKSVIFLQMDRSNSEQWMTDNAWLMNQIFPSGFNLLRRVMSMGIIGDRLGPRGLVDATASGGPPTSLDNCCTGTVENADLVYRISDFDNGLLRAYLHDSVNDDNYLTENSRFGFFHFLGLDDQFIGIGCNHLSTAELISRVSKINGPDVLKARSLKMDIIDPRKGDSIKFFGMTVDFGRRSIYFSTKNLVSKLPVVEKSTIGDDIGTKYFSRYTLLPEEIKEIADKVFSRHRLIRKSFTEFFPCVESYSRNLSHFGFSVEETFNEFNPTEKILLGDALSRFGHFFDLEHVPTVEYPDDVVSDWLTEIKNNLRSDYAHNY